MVELFFKTETFKSLKKMIESFFSINNFKVGRKLRISFFIIKIFESCKAVMEFFLSFRSFESHMTEFFTSGHASLSFHMMHKFPGTIFSLSVPTDFFSLYISLTIHFNLHEESCRAHLSKYCKSYFPTTQINGFTYMSEAPVPSFPSYSCSEHFRKLLFLLLLLLLLSSGSKILQASVYELNSADKETHRVR